MKHLQRLLAIAAVYGFIAGAVGCSRKPKFPRAMVHVRDKSGSGYGAPLYNRTSTSPMFSIEWVEKDGRTGVVEWEHVRTTSERDAYLFTIRPPAKGEPKPPITRAITYGGTKTPVHDGAECSVWIETDWD